MAVANRGKLLNLYEVIGNHYLIEEESYGFIVDLEGQGLEKRDVDIHQFLIVEVEIERDELIQEWVTQNII